MLCYFVRDFHAKVAKICAKYLQLTENEISYKIIGIAIELHKNIGLGLLASVYQSALAYDLGEVGLDAKQQVVIPFIYKEIRQDIGFRIDLLVENKVLIELKSIED